MIIANYSILFTQPPKLLAQSDNPLAEIGEGIASELETLFAQGGLTIISALLIFIIGWWPVAWLVRGGIKKLLKKTEIDNRIATWLTGQQGEEPIAVEYWIGEIFLWLVRLFVLVGALQILQLDVVTEPLNTLLNQITGFLPQIGAAGILLGIAWLLATLVRILTVRILRAFDIDQRFGEQLGSTDTDNELTVSEAVGNTLYWLIFLLFLPSVLSTLELEGTLRPVQELVNNILGILPNIFAAILIGLIGWFIAQIVRKIVTNLLTSAGVDQLGSRVGLSGTGQIQSLSWIVGTVVYVLILIPVAIAALEALRIQAISQPAVAMLDQVLNTLPRIFTATLVLLITYFLAQYVSEFVTNLLTNVGFNNIPTWLGLQRPAGESDEADTIITDQGETTESPVPRRTPSELMGIITLVGLMLFATLAAVNILDIQALTDLVAGIVLVSGQIIAGLIIFAIGLYFANLAFNLTLSSGIRQSRTLAQAARIVIIAFSLALGLQQMGIAPNIVNLAFGLLLGAVAVAIALAFGLGAREIAAEQVREWVNNFKSSNE
ncbi:MAG: mechanosensitive ion channel [Halothece sp.]